MNLSDEAVGTDERLWAYAGQLGADRTDERGEVRQSQIAHEPRIPGVRTRQGVQLNLALLRLTLELARLHPSFRPVSTHLPRGRPGERGYTMSGEKSSAFWMHAHLDSKFNPLGLRTTREITIDDFRGLGRLIVPKGTLVTPNPAGDRTDGSSITVDAYLTPDAVFYGVRIGVDDIEPPDSQ